MTTVQIMLKVRPFRAAGLPVALLLVALSLGACGSSHETVLVPPRVLVAPYDTARGDALWAVAPLGNESGISAADTEMVADALVAKIDEARGLSCLPLNRTLAVMRARNMRSIRTPTEARALAAALGVDALVVGNITEYDPYNPPKLGLTLALYSRDAATSTPLDPTKLKTSFTDYGQVTRSQYPDRPAAAISEHFDGANHEVQMALRRYQEGRHDPDSAMGWKGALASMSLYTEFAAYEAVSRLLEQERLRLGQPGGTTITAESPDTIKP